MHPSIAGVDPAKVRGERDRSNLVLVAGTAGLEMSEFVYIAHGHFTET